MNAMRLPFGLYMTVLPEKIKPEKVSTLGNTSNQIMSCIHRKTLVMRSSI